MGTNSIANRRAWFYLNFIITARLAARTAPGRFLVLEKSRTTLFTHMTRLRPRFIMSTVSGVLFSRVTSRAKFTAFFAYVIICSRAAYLTPNYDLRKAKRKSGSQPIKSPNKPYIKVVRGWNFTEMLYWVWELTKLHGGRLVGITCIIFSETWLDRTFVSERRGMVQGGYCTWTECQEDLDENQHGEDGMLNAKEGNEHLIKAWWR